jgi:hypothetical protein
MFKDDDYECPTYEDWPDDIEDMSAVEREAYFFGWRARYQWARQKDAQEYNGEIFGPRKRDTDDFRVDDTLK